MPVMHDIVCHALPGPVAPAPFKGVGVSPWRASAVGVRQQVPFRELGTLSNVRGT